MGDRTKISWTDATWSCLRGCSRTIAAGATTSGCGDPTGGGCYAERNGYRFAGPGLPYEGLVRMTPKGARWTGKVRLVDEHLLDPIHWQRPRRIFTTSVSDPFHEHYTDETIAILFGVMVVTQRHTHQLLTKRVDRMLAWYEWLARAAGSENGGRGMSPAAYCFALLQRYVRDRTRFTEADSKLLSRSDLVDAAFGASWPPCNVIPMASVEHQFAADDRVPKLLRVPAVARGLSCEPLLSGLSLETYLGGKYDERRISAIGPDCNGAVLGEQKWGDLEALPAGEWQRTTITTTDPGDTACASRGEGDQRVSPRSVHGPRGSETSIRAQDRMDRAQPPADTSIAGGQSQGRKQIEQCAIEPRNRDQAGQRAPCTSSARSAIETSLSGSEAHDRAGWRDSSSLRRESFGAHRNRCDVQRVSEDGQQDRTSQVISTRPGIHWIICGAESGPGARPANPAWFRSIVEQCRAAGVAVFIKQIVVGGKLRHDVREFPADLQIQEFPR